MSVLFSWTPSPRLHIPECLVELWPAKLTFPSCSPSDWAETQEFVLKKLISTSQQSISKQDHVKIMKQFLQKKLTYSTIQTEMTISSCLIHNSLHYDNFRNHVLRFRSVLFNSICPYFPVAVPEATWASYGSLSIMTSTRGWRNIKACSRS